MRRNIINGYCVFLYSLSFHLSCFIRGKFLVTCAKWNLQIIEYFPKYSPAVSSFTNYSEYFANLKVMLQPQSTHDSLIHIKCPNFILNRSLARNSFL